MMSNVYIGSDFHLGHKNIHKFRCPDLGFKYRFVDEADHREWLLGHLDAALTKRDTLIILGDCAFTEEALLSLHNRVRCNKILVRGNHDLPATVPKTRALYDKVFTRIEGLFRYKKQWLSHAPIHPDELRGSYSVHGHTHYHNVNDLRYFNCCVENMVNVFNKPLALWDDVISILNERNRL